MKRYFLILLLIMYVAVCHAQHTDSITIRFMDVEIPLADVSVYTTTGNFVSSSNKDGYARLAGDFLKNGYVVAVKSGYQLYPVRRLEPVIYMSPLSATLKETIVKAYSSKQVLHSGREYVVDYNFVGDNPLVATYSGSNGKNAKLFLLNNAGDTLALTYLPEEPLSLFKSCNNQYYCICYYQFYPLTIDSGKIKLDAPVSNSYLPYIEACKAMLDNFLYYKIVKPDSFVVDYGYVAEGDSIFHSFKRFDDKQSFLASREEDLNYTEDERLKYKHKYDMGLLTALWNRGSLKMIDMPLFTKDDSLLLFDMKARQIVYYTPIGIPLKSTGILFTSSNLHSDILKDPQTDKFYISLHTNKPQQELLEINLENGDLGDQVVQVEKPFAEKIKVHNGNIYYLWQDGRHGGVRQLYVQQGF